MSAVANGLRLRPRQCRCGGQLVRSIRMGPEARQWTHTLCCFSCGDETPSLYGRTTNQRNAGGVVSRAQTYPIGSR